MKFALEVNPTNHETILAKCNARNINLTARWYKEYVNYYFLWDDESTEIAFVPPVVFRDEWDVVSFSEYDRLLTVEAVNKRSKISDRSVRTDSRRFYLAGFLSAQPEYSNKHAEELLPLADRIIEDLMLLGEPTPKGWLKPAWRDKPNG